MLVHLRSIDVRVCVRTSTVVLESTNG